MKPSNLHTVIVLTVIIASSFCTKMQAQDLRSAIMLTRSEQYDKAGEIFKNLIRSDPGNSDNYFYYGENQLMDYFADTISNSLTVISKAAKDLYEKGIKANPADALNYIGLAKIAFYRGDNKTADEMRSKAHSLLLPPQKRKRSGPRNKAYAFGLAKIAESYINENKVDTSRALPLIREAIKIDSKNSDIYLIAGNIYILAHDGSDAIMNYKLAQYYDPESPTANVKIGNTYLSGGNPEAAIHYYEEAIRLNANYAPAYRDLGQLYSISGKYDKSRENFKKYLELTSGDIPSRISYVTALFYAKEYDEVVKNVEEILAVDKSRTYLNRIAAYSCYEKKPPDLDRALAFMDTLFKTVPTDRINKYDYKYMARILLDKNQNYPGLVRTNKMYKAQLEHDKSLYENALPAEKKNLKIDIDSLNIKLSDLGKQIASADREIDTAFVNYKKFLSYDPDNTFLLNEIGNLYYRFNRYESAAKTWSRLLALGKTDVADYMQIGKAYYLGDRYNPADSVFNVVISKYPDYLDAYIYAARTGLKIDPDSKSPLTSQKFEKVLEEAKADTVKYAGYINEACEYLGYYNLINGDYEKAKDYYKRMISADPADIENKVNGYQGLGAVEIKIANNEKSREEKLSSLARASAFYKQILALEPNNETAERLLNYAADYEAQIKKGINPDELRGVIKNNTGHPVMYATVRVKDTAAETYSDVRGEFKFELPMESKVLIISAKGYNQKEIPVSRPLKFLSVELMPLK